MLKFVGLFLSICVIATSSRTSGKGLSDLEKKFSNHPFIHVPHEPHAPRDNATATNSNASKIIERETIGLTKLVAREVLNLLFDQSGDSTVLDNFKAKAKPMVENLAQAVTDEMKVELGGISTLFQQLLRNKGLKLVSTGEATSTVKPRTAKPSPWDEYNYYSSE